MTRRIVMAFLVLVISAASALTVAGPAAAEGPVLEPAAIAKEEVSTQAWECSSGNFCVWENTNGTGRRCMWSDADPDWWGGNIVCSWADDTPVESFLNNGTSTRFTGVRVYQGADHNSPIFGCIPRGKRLNITAGGVKLRSHQWVTYPCL